MVVVTFTSANRPRVYMVCNISVVALCCSAVCALRETLGGINQRHSDMLTTEVEMEVSSPNTVF